MAEPSTVSGALLLLLIQRPAFKGRFLGLKNKEDPTLSKGSKVDSFNAWEHRRIFESDDGPWSVRAWINK